MFYCYGLLFASIMCQAMADPLPPRVHAELAAVQMKPGEVLPMVKAAAAVDRSTWTASADTYQDINPPSAAIDSNLTTFWHSSYYPTLAPLPHSITIDFHTFLNLNGLVYTPRQDGNSNGNIGQHQVQVSTDGNTWTTVAFGTYLDDNEVKTTPFVTTAARYLRIIALTEAGNRGRPPSQW